MARRVFTLNHFIKPFIITAAIAAGVVSLSAQQTVSQLFTASGTFTAPLCVTSVQVQSWGGGGGGGGSISNPANNSGGGGGGGAYVLVASVPVIPGNTYTVTVGAGGTSGVAVSGGNGGASSFNGTAMAAGGAGGALYNNFFSAGNGAGGAGGTGGTYNGGNGHSGSHPDSGGGGGGGAGSAGNGGNAGLTIAATGGTAGPGAQPGGVGGDGGTTDGLPGVAPAGGGGGSNTQNLLGGTSRAGGAGAPGQVIVTYIDYSPSITNVSGGGCTGGNITINGNNLGGATSVTIGSSPVINLIISTTQIVGTIAPGTTTGLVTVTTPCGLATSSSSFIIIPPAAPVVLPSQSICAGGSLTFGTHVLTAAGTYSDTTSSTMTGCDSITTVTLSVTSVTTQSISRSICSGGSYTFGGQVYSAAGTYSDTATSVITGCDSITTLTLSVNPVAAQNIAQTICAGGSYTFGGQVYTSAGTYSDTTTSVMTGCDSITTLTLSVTPVNPQVVSQAICAGSTYMFNGQSYSAAGTYTDTLSGAGMNGCDSVVTLMLAVNPYLSSSISDSICSGGSYNFNGTAVTTPGTYMDTLTGAGVNGCDSVVTLTLSIKSTSTLPVTASASPSTICSSDSSEVCATSGFTIYHWNNGSNTVCFYTRLAGNYYLTATDANGCTAVSNHISVSVNPQPPVSISVNGDTLTAYNSVTYQWYLNGNVISGATSNIYIATQGGSYTVMVTDSNGCAATSTPVTVSGVGDVAEESAVNVFRLTSGSWQLTVGNNFIGGEAEVFDANGRVVLSSKLKEQSSKIEFDGAKGFYLLRISSTKSSVVRKLVRL